MKIKLSLLILLALIIILVTMLSCSKFGLLRIETTPMACEIGRLRLLAKDISDKIFLLSDIFPLEGKTRDSYAAIFQYKEFYYSYSIEKYSSSEEANREYLDFVELFDDTRNGPFFLPEQINYYSEIATNQKKGCGEIIGEQCRYYATYGEYFVELSLSNSLFEKTEDVYELFNKMIEIIDQNFSICYAQMD